MQFFSDPLSEDIDKNVQNGLYEVLNFFNLELFLSITHKTPQKGIPQEYWRFLCCWGTKLNTLIVSQKFPSPGIKIQSTGGGIYHFLGKPKIIPQATFYLKKVQKVALGYINLHLIVISYCCH